MNEKGFSLVELLVVVAIIGILVAIAVPNLLDAIDRSKQRATVAEIRIWGLALQEYNASSSPSTLPPPTGAGGCAAAEKEVDTALRAALVPFTINTLSLEDKWRHPLCYGTNQIDSYTIRSRGKDGIAGGGVTPSTWNDYTLDIVLSDGIFVNQPS